MLIRTDDFKEEIKKLGKQIDFKIDLHTNDKLITQDNKFILTQDDNPLVVEQFDLYEVDEVFNGDSIYNASVVRKGNLLSTMMKEVDFEIREELRVGDLIDCAFGLKVGEDYEYVNYGRFIIYSKEKNEDTNTYSYVAYDSMLLSMVEVDDTSIIQNVTVKQAIDNICNKVGLISKVSSEDILLLPNLNKVINEKAFTNVEMTYRDVLDMICQCLGVSMISYGRSLELKYFDNTIVDDFNEEYLKDINVRFGEKYGAINSVALSRSEDKDIIYRKDDEDIAKNGLHEFKIKDNLIMLYDDREDYIDEIYNQLKGLEFYINDFTSTGIAYLEWLDFYNVEVGEKTYKCLMLNDEIKIQQGLEESIYTEQPEETTTDYKVAGKTDKEVSFIVDKQNGEIKSRVTQDEMETAIKQTASSIELTTIDNGTSAGITIKLKNEDGTELDSDTGNITMNGLVKFTDLSTSGSTTINGANITTGTINADLIKTGQLELSGYSYDESFIRLGDFNATDPYGVRIWDRGISAVDYGGTPRIRTENGNGYAELYGDVVNAFGFNNVSLAEKKKDFELLKSGLNIIKDIDIYKYRYKDEETNKKHIGLVIGDNYKYSKEVTTDNNSEVDIYSFVSVCCKAIQEQQKMIEELQKEVNLLKESDK